MLPLDIAIFMEPADEVGGDYYDVFCTDGVVTLCIGDVTEHGVKWHFDGDDSSGSSDFSGS
ncbi:MULTISPECIES: hypothetical protein [unclassified Microcoleus]|uniref:hypothetical protein n=2 Tax=unclassified Microcoleus TaxID=2642155 RepID=UPI002FD4A40F